MEISPVLPLQDISRKEFKKSVIFLAPIVIGAVAGVLVSASLVLYLIETFTLQSYALFIGLVLGSVPVIYGKMKPGIKGGINCAFFVLGLVYAMFDLVCIAFSNENGVK